MLQSWVNLTRIKALVVAQDLKNMLTKATSGVFGDNNLVFTAASFR